MINKDNACKIEDYASCLRYNNNSYKFVLGLAILKIKEREEGNYIDFYKLAEEITEIYFRNIFKFNINENGKNKETRVEQIMKNYFTKYGYTSELTNTDKKNISKLIVENKKDGFFKYTLPCFDCAKKDDKGRYLYPDKGKNDFFYYDIDKEEIILTDDFLNLIKKEKKSLNRITIEKYELFLKKRNENIKNIHEILKYYYL